MTLGFAIARTPRQNPSEWTVLVAADTRLTLKDLHPSDAGIKTYELGGRAVMVASGQTLPAVIAAETVRPIIEGHNRRELPARRMSFYDTCRLFAFFLRRAATDQSATCTVCVAGFLSSGNPVLAHLVVSPSRNRLWFDQPEGEDGTVLIPVGTPKGKTLLLRGLEAAKKDGKPVQTAALALLWHMNQHPAFTGIGGGVSVGVCRAQDDGFHWPIIELAERRFLRGFEVTAHYRPGWPPPIVIPYDEQWCSEQDQLVACDTDPFAGAVVQHGAGYEIDELSTPETLFQTHDDPIAFENGIAVGSQVRPRS